MTHYGGVFNDSHNSAVTEVLFARGMSAIDLSDAHNFETYIAWEASDDQHVTYENDPLDELYTTFYSDLYEH